MTPPLEHDYIGLAEPPPPPPAARAEGFLLGMELRLGLPGSESPERKEKERERPPVLTLGLPKGYAPSSGAKRGFSDAIDGAGKWGLAGTGGGSDVGLGKGGGTLFSPRGEGGGGRQGGGNGVRGRDSGGGGPAAAGKGGVQEKKGGVDASGDSGRGIAPAAKAQVVGWPPIRSYRKNTMAANTPKNSEDVEDKQGSGCLYVKVSMDGAPYLRKVDLKMYCNYKELSSALEKMFSCFTIGHCGGHAASTQEGLGESRLNDLHGSEYVLTYEDKDGDWMLVGDVPWAMFTDTCKRLRIMKGSEAIGLTPRVHEKCKGD